MFIDHFAVLAFAQPFLPHDENAIKDGKPALMIYLDNSFSMAQQGTEGELFSESKRKCKTHFTKSPKQHIGYAQFQYYEWN